MVRGGFSEARSRDVEDSMAERPSVMKTASTTAVIGMSLRKSTRTVRPRTFDAIAS